MQPSGSYTVPKELTVMIFAMLVAAPAAYGVIIYLLVLTGQRQPESNPTYFYAFFAISFLQILLVPILERVQIAAWRGGKQSAGSVSAQVKQITIVRIAQVETIFVLGLLVFVLTWDYHTVYYFYALGIPAGIVYWPTRTRLEQLSKTLEAK
jgi:hypothetical protein